MKACFKPKRYFFAGKGWYMYMRAGDEYFERHYIDKHVHHDPINNITVAGPFQSKRALFIWARGFISAHGTSRRRKPNLIPDSLIVSDRNSITV